MTGLLVDRSWILLLISAPAWYESNTTWGVRPSASNITRLTALPPPRSQVDAPKRASLTPASASLPSVDGEQ